MRLSLSRVEVQLTGLHEVMRKEAALGANGSDDLSQLSATPPVRGPDGASQWSAGTRAELLGRRRVEGRPWSRLIIGRRRQVSVTRISNIVERGRLCRLHRRSSHSVPSFVFMPVKTNV